MNFKIPLIKDTINDKDIESLISWLKTNPRLTKGEQNIKFEKLWSEYNGNKFSTYVNSGSSANLIAFYALLLSGRLKNKKVVVPALSWVTTIAPVIQFGLEPIMCDCNLENLGLDIEHLKKIVKEENPSMIVTVNVLGFANDYQQILEICKNNNIILFEDSCESIGTIYDNKRTGNFGEISTFSYYFGHHISTIEGGMVCTNDEELSDICTSIRSHGWDRDLSDQKKKVLREKNNINNFKSLYTFYYPGFNVRSTDLQAFLGINQLNKIDSIVQRREEIYHLYNDNINVDKKITLNNHQKISNFAYPIIDRNIDIIIEKLLQNSIETRPLICGSMGKQPYWIERYGNTDLKNADLINEFGIYLPNNPYMTNENVFEILEIINEYSKGINL
jgi:CDP-6-deoxy-D-xylo-4-hexulose-3-dehydrase